MTRTSSDALRRSIKIQDGGASVSLRSKKKAGFTRFAWMSVCAVRVLHHSFLFVLSNFVGCFTDVFKNLYFFRSCNKTRRTRWASRKGLVLFVFKENFPIDGPLWEVPNLLLLLWRHAFVCSKTKHLLLFVCVLCCVFLWQSQKCQYMYKNVKNRFKIRLSNV